MPQPDLPIPVKDWKGRVIGKVIDIQEDEHGLIATMDIAGDEFRGLALAKDSVSEATAEVFMPRGALARGPRNLPQPDARKALRQQQRESRRRNRGRR